LLSDYAQEAEQEQDVREGKGSIFDEAPPADIIRLRAFEFDDNLKHFVRKTVWLKVARHLFEKKGSGLRLLTLPGPFALEVKLYNKEQLLAASSLEEGAPLDVVAFEREPTAAGQLKLGVPRLKRVFTGCLLDALVNPRSPNHDGLVECFPFDVVNLDLTSNIVAAHDAPYGKALRAITECMRRQGRQDVWALMVTFKASVPDTNPDTINELRECYRLNIETYSRVRAACEERYKTADAGAVFEADPEHALSEFLAKWIVEQAHVIGGWRSARFEHVYYRRTPGENIVYQIRKLIFRLERVANNRRALPTRGGMADSWEIDDIVSIVRSGNGLDAEASMREEFGKKPAFESAIRAEIEAFKAMNVVASTGGDSEAES
jgi:hypothetical protein